MTMPGGSPATGDGFIDRERETAFILDTIKIDHVMLVAPRRSGKTSSKTHRGGRLLNASRV
jgi:hypothetical protein